MADAAPASNAPLPPDTAPTAAPPRRSRWRIPRTIAICLLLGAIMNIAVAWSLAAWLPLSGWRMQLTYWPEEHVHFEWREFSTWGGTRNVWSSTPNGLHDTLLDWVTIPDPQVEEVRVDEKSVEWPTRDRERFLHSDLPKTVWGCRHDAGWPSRAVRYDVSFDDTRSSFVASDGIALTDLSFVARDRPFRALPLRPIWPGLLINTLFYALIAGCLWPVPFGLRRVLRRRRNLCIRCGYARAGIAPDAACPECGAR